MLRTPSALPGGAASRLRACAVIALAAVSNACLVVSLQPAYDADSVIFEQALVGVWQNTSDQTSATIERAEWRAYKVSYTDRFTTLTFHANLTKSGGAEFLDLTQVRGSDEGPYLVPVHGVVRVSVGGDTLRVEPLDYAWFSRSGRSGGVSGLGTAIDDRRNVVVTSSTPELRRWLARAPDEAFGAEMTFTRSK